MLSASLAWTRCSLPSGSTRADEESIPQEDGYLLTRLDDHELIPTEEASMTDEEKKVDAPVIGPQ